MNDTHASTVTTRLRPTRGWVGLDVGELLRFRHLLVAFAQRDVKLRYKQTLIGVAWVVIQPLIAAGIFSVVFGVIAGMKTSTGRSYFVFSFAGLLAWNIFGSTLTKSAMSMVGNTHLVTKVYFPRLILPLSTAASTLIDFAIPTAVLLLVLVVSGNPPGWAILLTPIWASIALFLALGLGLVAAAMTIDYRDVQYVLPLVTPFLLYASPVAYDVTHVPGRYQTIYYLANPLASVIEAFRWSAIGAPPPHWGFLAYAAACSAVVFTIGAAIFKRTERRVADVI
jgi:lipopolysaccharide transport system permease protein